jgi:uncharacterized protein
MKISMHTMAIDSFVSMLESLSALLDKGEAFANGKSLDLVNARLAPDMYTLAQQVILACYNAKDGTARLTGTPWAAPDEAGKTMAELKAQIAATVKSLRAGPAAAFEGAEERDCSIEPPNTNIVIAMDGLQFLRGRTSIFMWSRLTISCAIAASVSASRITSCRSALSSGRKNRKLESLHQSTPANAL